MKCPHCLVTFHEGEETWESSGIGTDQDGSWSVESTECPACSRVIARLIRARVAYGSHFPMTSTTSEYIRPRNSGRPPAPTDVPNAMRVDYKQACLVLADSPKASAALSRRTLQVLLRDRAGVKHRNLNDEIDEVLGRNTLPSHLSEAIDAVRVIGNFAAHPIKSANTSEIVDVEPGEAEWLLDVLEGLFDFYFVQPAVLQSKRDALNVKLADAGKPPLK